MSACINGFSANILPGNPGSINLWVPSAPAFPARCCCDATIAWAMPCYSGLAGRTRRAIPLVCDCWFAGGPWNEPLLPIAILSLRPHRARPVLDGGDGAQQFQAKAGWQDA